MHLGRVKFFGMRRANWMVGEVLVKAEKRCIRTSVTLGTRRGQDDELRRVLGVFGIGLLGENQSSRRILHKWWRRGVNSRLGRKIVRLHSGHHTKFNRQNHWLSS